METSLATTPRPQPSRTVLDVLVCPLSGGALDVDWDRCELISRAAGLAFPVRDGIPIMLVDEARRIGAQDSSA